MAGRKPKPTAIKELEGNPGKRKLNKKEPKPEKGMLVCPEWLLPEAKVEWKHLSEKLNQMGVLTEVDMAAFAAYYQSYARWKEAQEHNSIAYELHTKAIDILEGRRVDPTFYPVVYGLKDDEDWEDEANWYKVNPSLGYTVDIERLRDAYREAKQNPADEITFRWLCMNQWVSSTTAWINLIRGGGKSSASCLQIQWRRREGESGKSILVDRSQKRKEWQYATD